MATISYKIKSAKVLKIHIDDVRALIEAASRICGSQTALADRLGVTRSAVQQWINGATAPRYKHESAMRDIIAGGGGGTNEKQ